MLIFENNIYFFVNLSLTMKSYLALIVCILLTIQSCKKDSSIHDKGPDCSQKATLYISSEISNFKFKKGSYWIFIDSVSLVIDTMRVDTVKNSIMAYQYCPNNYHEFYSISMHPKNIYTVSDYYSLDDNRFMLNQTNESGDGSTIYADNYSKTDSLFIYDRYYKSVVVNTRLNDVNENGNKCIRYINATFGFLKKEVYNSSNQLVSKKVLKDKLIIR
jgi:hypothetical protein